MEHLQIISSMNVSGIAILNNATTHSSSLFVSGKLVMRENVLPEPAKLNACNHPGHE
jgi:hypothetical protein